MPLIGGFPLWERISPIEELEEIHWGSSIARPVCGNVNQLGALCSGGDCDGRDPALRVAPLPSVSRRSGRQPSYFAPQLIRLLPSEVHDDVCA